MFEFSNGKFISNIGSGLMLKEVSLGIVTTFSKNTHFGNVIWKFLHFRIDCFDILGAIISLIWDRSKIR